MTRAARIGYWALPIAFCLGLYWLGIRIWFAQDDFAWLNLRNQVYDFKSLLDALFAPLAQGTIRPLSERGFFMLFSYLFGLRALPYRLFIFLNQCLNVVLLALVARKLTKSDLAGLAAPLLWLANVALVAPMAWTSAYNEIQCTTFILTSFYLFLRYAETGQRKYYWAQFVTFLIGFGSLEINVVYPAIAALYAFLFARKYLRSTAPMFVVSAIFAVLDRLAAAGHNGGYYYEMNWSPGSLLLTLARYVSILLGVASYGRMRAWPPWAIHGFTAVLAIVLLGFAAWQISKRHYLPLFLLGWFMIVLAPLLPLYHHVTEYYLTIPSVAVAILAAYGLSLAWQRGWPATAVAAALMLAYVVPSVLFIKQAMVIYFNRADQARALVQSVAYAKRIHPGKTILLANVSDELFWSAVYDSPFRPLGWHDVFMLPDCLPAITADPHLVAVDRYVLPAAAVAEALDEGAAVVYAVENRHLRNITRAYTAIVDSRPDPPLASEVNVGEPFFDKQIGDGWYRLEQGYRWSGRHAAVYLPGPSSAAQKLYVSGTVPDVQRKAGPLHLALTIEGRPQPVKTIAAGADDFTLTYDIPADFMGQRMMQVAFTLDRTVHVPSDNRDLGLVFGRFSVK